MSDATEYIWLLKLRVSNLTKQLDAYRNGNKIKSMRAEYASIIHKKDSEIRELKSELAKSHAREVTIRKYWSQIMDDTYEDARKLVEAETKKTLQMEERALRAEKQRDKALDERTEWRHKYYEQAERIEELEGQVQKLTAQVNKDFQNSSIPSSQQRSGRKKIPNSREKTGRNRGGQTGHKGHRLTQQKPTKSIHIPDPEKYMNDPDYYATENLVKRQKIVLRLGIEIVEYTATEFRNRKTGSRVHADFPDGYDTDISYDSSVKAFAFLLANEGNVSAEKIHSILYEASGGKLNISSATINGLSKEFSEKSEKERAEIIRVLMESPVLNVDFTNANVNGSAKQVLIMASPSRNVSMFMARDTKGHAGISGSPIENYVGTLVHDHDTTFYSYGLRHQECMQHNERYTIGSEENEPELTWNKKMHDLIKEMLHYKNSIGENGDFDSDIVASLEKRYDEILDEAEKEYEDTPPTDYYRDGYNLYLRLKKFKESELLFLYDRSVPANNSLAERLARIYKRKQKQSIVLRSDDNFRYLCDSLSVITSYRYQDQENLYNTVAEIFARSRSKPQ